MGEPQSSGPPSSKRWRRVFALLALPAVNAGLAVLAGFGVWGCPLLLVTGGIYAAGFALAPPPGRCRLVAPRGHPLLASMLAVSVATGLTGGLSSPFLVLLPTPVLFAWTTHGPGRQSAAVSAAFVAGLLALFALPRVWPAPPLERGAFEALVAWSALLCALLIAGQIRLLFRGLKETSASLDCVRRLALDDAAGRRRGLESIAARLAHELKNPLAAIKSLVQLQAETNRGDVRSHRRFEVMASEVVRMESILREYLTFARPLDELELADVNIESVVEDVVAVLAGRADLAGVQLDRRGRSGVVRADGRQLKEALLNLTANALEATPRGGRVTLLYDVGQDAVRMAVRDTGKGMTPTVAARVGTPFFTTREGGTGLGVVIARSAIVQHGGTLEFDSRPQIGTSALITLPLATAGAWTEAEAAHG
jgi:signal transduction histidine kinase